jgi:hypothetical protein
MQIPRLRHRDPYRIAKPAALGMTPKNQTEEGFFAALGMTAQNKSTAKADPSTALLRP